MIRTLIVDGNSLLNTGFHGIKNMYNGEDHIGGLYHFLNTLRKLIDEYLITKVVVFWDGEDNTKLRKKLYPEYKSNRKKKSRNIEDIESYAKQKVRTQEYLEELYVRQSTFKFCEADDGISYYCEKALEEEKIVLTSDRDLLQLISPTTSLHIISLNKLFKFEDKVPLDGIYIPHQNVRLVKTICGDSSDNIKGIKMVGIKSLIKIKPEISEKKVELEQLINEIKNRKKRTVKENNIINGITNNNRDNPLEINYQIIETGKKFLTTEAMEGIRSLLKESLDPEGRHWKNALDLMMSDGILNILPKTNDGWVDFVRPYLRLSRIEKDFYKKNKKN